MKETLYDGMNIPIIAGLSLLIDTDSARALSLFKTASGKEYFIAAGISIIEVLHICRFWATNDAIRFLHQVGIT